MTIRAEFPKVAILSANPLCGYTSNGILLKSLFTGWPPDRLMQIYFPLGGHYPPDGEMGIESRRIHPTGRVSCLIAAHKAESTPTASTTRGQHSFVASLRRMKGIFGWTKLAQETWYSHSWIGRVMRKQLADYQPDIVYALLGNYSLTKNALLACKGLRIPLFLHVADDFVRSSIKTCLLVS